MLCPSNRWTNKVGASTLCGRNESRLAAQRTVSASRHQSARCERKQSSQIAVVMRGTLWTDLAWFISERYARRCCRNLSACPSITADCARRTADLIWADCEHTGGRSDRTPRNALSLFRWQYFLNTDLINQMLSAQVCQMRSFLVIRQIFANAVDHH